MRIAKRFLICLCCLFVALSLAQGQASDGQARAGVLGYFDPHTGAFHPLTPAVQDDEEPLAPTTITGTVSVTITITVKTAGLTNFTCSIDVSTTDNITASPVLFQESNTVAATGTGSTRTCKLSIPYSWSLATQSTDSMTTAYFVTGSASATTGLPQRTSTRSPLDTRKVPANGAITNLTAAVTQ